MSKIVQITQPQVNRNVQMCLNWSEAITQTELALAHTEARIRRLRRKVGVVRLKVKAHEKCPIPGWDWSEILPAMEAQLSRILRHRSGLKRALRYGRRSMAAGEPFPVEARHNRHHG